MVALSKIHARVLARGGFRRGELVVFSGGMGGGKSQLTTHKEEGRYGQYGWEGPNKADKGLRLGSCNVTRCQRPGAYWYNKGTRAWYCTSCARAINHAPLPDGTYLCSPDEEARAEHFERLEARK